MTGLHNLLVRKSTSQLNTLEVMRARCAKYVSRIKKVEKDEDESTALSDDSEEDDREPLPPRPPTWPWLLPVQNPQTGSLLLSTLPTELLTLIGQFVLGPRWKPIVDCMSLATTCQMLYDILRPLLNKCLAQHPRDWVGDRIICVSDDGGNCRVPRGRFTASELVEYDLLEEADPGEKEEGRTSPSVVPYKYGDNILYDTPDHAEGWFKSVQADVWDDKMADTQLVRMFKEVAVTSPASKRNAESETPHYILVVLNRTKREYIRGDIAEAKANDPPFNRRPFTKMAKYVGEIAFYAVMWSDYAAFDVPPDMEDELARGRWAGDRIYLSSANDVDFHGLGKYAKWKDMTDRFVDIAFASQS